MIQEPTLRWMLSSGASHSEAPSLRENPVARSSMTKHGHSFALNSAIINTSAATISLNSVARGALATGRGNTRACRWYTSHRKLNAGCSASRVPPPQGRGLKDARGSRRASECLA